MLLAEGGHSPLSLLQHSRAQDSVQGLVRSSKFAQASSAPFFGHTSSSFCMLPLVSLLQCVETLISPGCTRVSRWVFYKAVWAARQTATNTHVAGVKSRRVKRPG